MLIFMMTINYRPIKKYYLLKKQSTILLCSFLVSKIYFISKMLYFKKVY